jgi:hypothetical protein
LLASLVDPTRPYGQADGDLYIRAFGESVSLHAVGYDYDDNWAISSVELSSTRTDASFAAQEMPQDPEGGAPELRMHAAIPLRPITVYYRSIEG